jgi:hypothetical protein
VRTPAGRLRSAGVFFGRIIFRFWSNQLAQAKSALKLKGPEWQIARVHFQILFVVLVDICSFLTARESPQLSRTRIARKHFVARFTIKNFLSSGYRWR